MAWRGDLIKGVRVADLSPEVVDGAKDGAKKVGDVGKGALEAMRPGLRDERAYP